MAGRPKLFNEQQSIDNAIEVFWNKSYDAASSDELLRAMGIGKGSFYLAFKGGKQELYERSLEQYAGRFYAQLQEELTAADDELEYLKEYFLSLADYTVADKNKGCYLGNALVQLSDKDDGVRMITGNLLKGLQQVFSAVVRKAQARGQISLKENPELIGWHLVNVWHGIHVTRRMDQSHGMLRAMIVLNLRILE